MVAIDCRGNSYTVNENIYMRSWTKIKCYFGLVLLKFLRLFDKICQKG